MADDAWIFGADDPAPVRQPIRIPYLDRKTGERAMLDLTAELGGLDAGSLLEIFSAVGRAADPDSESTQLVRTVRTLEALLVDDDGVTLEWTPTRQDADGKWQGHDGALHETLAEAEVPLSAGSSRRKLMTVIGDRKNWSIRLEHLDAASRRLTEATTGRPTVPASS